MNGRRLREHWDRYTAAHVDLLLAGLNVGLGAVLILGAPLRTSAPSFQIAKNVMPIQGWGLLFLTVGLLGWLTTRRPVLASWVLVAGFTVYTFWGVAFIVAVLDTPAASLTSVVVYTWLASLHLIAGIGLSREIRRNNRHRGL